MYEYDGTPRPPSLIPPYLISIPPTHSLESYIEPKINPTVPSLTIILNSIGNIRQGEQDGSIADVREHRP